MSTPPHTKPANSHPSKKGKLLKMLAALALVTIAVFQDVLVESMPENVKAVLEAAFKKYPYLWFTAIGIIVCILVVSAIWEPGKKGEAETEPAELTDEERQQFIKLLQNRYTRRLLQKTGERFALKLELRYTLNGMQQTERLDIAARQPGQPNAELAQLVQKHRNLLLMGQPGAGKTTLLLGTAITLLQEAIDDVMKPLPVIFNLASWKNTEPSFAEWMANVLVQGYSYPPKRAVKDVQDGNLLLLLDGLDEVGSHLEKEAERNALRKLCLEAIQQYQTQRQSPAGMIICTRTNEYLAAGGNAPVFAQLLIQPIDAEELRRCLQQISQGEGQPAFENPKYKTGNRLAAANLLQLTANSSNLTGLLCTPFYFNAALQVLHKPGDGSISFVHDGEHTRQKLEALYINRTLSNSQNKAYPTEKTRRWLSWLADWQQRRSSTSFELTDFGSKSLLLLPGQVIIYILFLGIVRLLAGGFVGILLFSLLAEANYILAGFLVGAINSVAIATAMGDGFRESIPTKDIIAFDIKKITSLQFLGYFGICFLMPVVINLIEEDAIDLVDNMIVGLLLCSYFCLLLGMRIVYFTEITRPTKRLYAGLKSLTLLFAVSLIGLSVLRSTGSINFTRSGLLFLIPLTTGVWMLSNLLPLLNLISIQSILFSLGHLPFRMARFFDYCANELHLLEKDTGGSWRFRHQIIQDYFAKRYTSERG
jgi:hypothetical protein